MGPVKAGKRRNKKAEPAYLPFPVNPDDSGGGLVGRRDKDGLPTDPVHVDAGSSLQVVQVDVAVFSDEEDHVLFGADLNKPRDKPG